jgi:hypothetical protein
MKTPGRRDNGPCATEEDRMDRPDASTSSIASLAGKEAAEVFALQSAGGDPAALRKEQILNFQNVYQPGLSESEYAVVYRTYDDLFQTTLRNLHGPGSRSESIAQQPNVTGPDDSHCKQMVDDLYREFLPYAFAGDAAKSSHLVMAFDDKVRKIVSDLPPTEGQAFWERMEGHRERIANEYKRDRLALKRRLGLSPDPVVTYQRPSAGQQLGDLAVRTAVRATVWESIRSIFRFFR